MDSRWYAGHKDKEARKAEVMSYRNAFDELKEFLDTHYAKADACRDYDSPGWEHKQIAFNEYNQVLKDIYSSINLNSKD